MSDSLNDILAALAVSNIPSAPATPTEQSPTEYDEKQELLNTLKGLDALIKMNTKMLDEASRLVESTGDAEYFEVYSNIGKAQSEAFKNKVKILTDKEKNKIMKETKDRELDLKEKLTNHEIGIGNIGPTTLHQTNNVIMAGSREEMYEMIVKMKAHEKSIQELDAVLVEEVKSE